MKHFRKSLLSFFVIAMLFTSGIPANAEADDYTLKEVVVLSRHNIRSPLSGNGSILDLATKHEWFHWSSAASELSLRGGILETEMGEYFRKWVVSEELMSESYQPEKNEVRFYANAKQRTIATANYFSAGFLPAANVPIEVNAPYDTMDPVFNPQITAMNEEYRKAAEQEMLGMIPDDLSQSYALLSDVIDYSDSDGYKNGKLKDFANGDTEIMLEIGKEPGMTGSLKTATSISDALVLQYYEEPDETAAAFGKNLTYDQWREIGGIKDLYTDVLFSAPSVSVQIANPLLQVIDAELGRNDRKFTFLCGHDSNIASVLASLGICDYASENSIETKTPIGGKLVFEKWEDANGSDYIKLRLVYQNKDQLRGMPLLTPDNPPSSLPLDIPGLTPNSDGLIPYEDFNRFLDEKVDAFDELKKKYGITDPTTSYVLQIPDTADR